MDITLERVLSLIPRKENGDFQHGSKKAFAKSIGLKSGNLISDWIAGRSDSYKRKLHEISDKYNVSLEWLKGESNIKEKAIALSDDLTKAELKEQLLKLSDAEILNLLAEVNEVRRKRGL